MLQSCTDMRELNDTTSEIVSQAYFSEEVSIEEESGNWVKIRTSDGYLVDTERCSYKVDRSLRNNIENIARISSNL